MDLYAWQLGGSALGLGVLAFGLNWWQSRRFDQKWKHDVRPVTNGGSDRSAEKVAHRPAA